MPAPNGSFHDTEVLSHSVTHDDAFVYNGSPLMFFALPVHGGYSGGALPPDAPLYWSAQRDIVLRATVLYESLWSSAVNIAATKTASLGWEVQGDYPLKVKRAQEMMLSLDNSGWVKAQGKGVRDFLTTDNGEWWEIVRATQGAGSRILGLMHLDSLRTFRTGDPARPCLYMDLKGRYHEMRDYQVINLVDMPNPGAEWLGIGLCAASRAYSHIFKLAAIERYISEKVSGSRPQEIHFVRGVMPKQIDQALKSSAESQAQKGAVMFRGAVVVPLPGDGQVDGYRVPLAELPDGFDRKQEFDLAITAYADAIGLDQQDLQPLSGQGLGTGAQSYVLVEKAKGKGLAARRQDWIHEINEKVNPDGVTFYFTERDLSDEQKEAEVSGARASTRATMLANGEITPIESRQLAVDSDDLPKEFTPPEGDVTPEDNLSDVEKPMTEGEAVEPLALPEPTLLPAQKEVSAKSVNEVLRTFKDTLTRWVVDTANGNMGATDLARAMRALVRSTGPQAYREGLREGGIKDPDAEMDDADEGTVNGWVGGQLEYVKGFAAAAAAVAELTGDAKTQARDAMLGRVDQWRDSLRAIGERGELSAKGNPMLTLDGEDGDESCRDCRKYKGQRHRRSWWEARGLLDRPNSNFECGRFADHCNHHYYDDSRTMVLN